MADDEDNETTLDIVLIKKPECLKCAYLIPDLREKKYDCYGSRSCPAVTYQVALGVDLTAYSDRLAKAWHDGDTERIGEIMGRLSDKHEAVRTKVIKLAKTRLRDL